MKHINQNIEVLVYSGRLSTSQHVCMEKGGLARRPVTDRFGQHRCCPGRKREALERGEFTACRSKTWYAARVFHPPCDWFLLFLLIFSSVILSVVCLGAFFKLQYSSALETSHLCLFLLHKKSVSVPHSLVQPICVQTRREEGGRPKPLISSLGSNNNSYQLLRVYCEPCILYAFGFSKQPCRWT